MTYTNYVLVDKNLCGKSFVDGIRTSRIYKVIETGPDWFLLKVRGKPTYIYKEFCVPSSEESYRMQDHKVETIPEFNFEDSLKYD